MTTKQKKLTSLASKQKHKKQQKELTKRKKVVKVADVAKETTYSVLAIEINEIDHSKLGKFSPKEVLSNIGKTIESCLTKQDRVFSKHYGHQLPVGNKAMLQLTDNFIIISPLSSKHTLRSVKKNIISKLKRLGVHVKTGIAEYGVDGVHYQEVFQSALQEIRPTIKQK